MCEHGGHDDGTSWCDEAKGALVARLDFLRIKFGADFETHGGRKVMYLGKVGWDHPPVPYGAIGTIESSSRGGMVWVKWEDCMSDVGIPNPFYSHSWDELEILRTDDEGEVLPGELGRARLKTAPSILKLALPCPFCRGRKIQFSTEHGYRHAFCTSDCWASGPAISDQFPELMVVAIWNIRGVPEALTKEIRGFPGGDVEVSPTVERRDVPDVQCPWCLGTKIRVSYCERSKLYHGHCDGCGAFSPWWPYDKGERRRGGSNYDKDLEGVIEGWRHGFQKAHQSAKR